MAERKTVKPGHVVENGEASVNEDKIAHDELQESEGVYQPGLAPLAVDEKSENQTSPYNPEAPDLDNASGNQVAADDNSDFSCLVVLKNGASFWYKGRIFKNGVPNAIENKDAARLIKSGFFERG